MLTYTFHVSLPGLGRVWRKIELPAEATLEQLHLAIQSAYRFDNDHLYSFFMSGKAWDSESEYTIYEDLDWNPFFLSASADDDEDWSEETIVWDERFGDESTPPPAANVVSLAELPPSDVEPAQVGEELSRPTPQDLRNMFAQLKDDPSAREQLMQKLSDELGLPPLMAQMVLGNLDAFVSNVSDEELDEVLSLDLDTMLSGEDDEAEEEESDVGDVRSTTLASLELKKGQSFLYLFDYGDEWRFSVKLHTVNADADPELRYPRVVESVGEAPAQYPDWDEEEDFDPDGDGLSSGHNPHGSRE